MDAPFKPGDFVVFRKDCPWSHWITAFQHDLGGPGPYLVLSCARLPDGRAKVALAGGLELYDAWAFVLAPGGHT